MKRGISSTYSQPIVRIIMVSPNLFQLSFRNIYGYLKTVLIDRCKKVGAQYRYYQKSYFITFEKLQAIKQEFLQVQQIKNTKQNMTFKIQEFPRAQIKSIVKASSKKNQKNQIQNRFIFIDKLSLYRYSFLKKQIENVFNTQASKSQLKQQSKSILIIASQENLKIWTNSVLAFCKKSSSIAKIQSTQQKIIPILIQLTYSQLTTKKVSLPKTQLTKIPSEKSQLQHKIYLLIYDHMKFVQSSWFLKQCHTLSAIFLDDGQHLIPTQSQLSTLQNKKRNLQALKLILAPYDINKPISIFISKLTQPTSLLNLLTLLKPKNFTGIKFSSSLTQTNCFNQFKLSAQQKTMYEQFNSWFRKRYRHENKCFKEIYYLLRSTVLKIMDQKFMDKKFGKVQLMNVKSFESLVFKTTLLQIPSQTIQKYRTIQNKYKKQCPTINIKQLLQSLHDKQKMQQKRFQISSNHQDHVNNKTSKHFFVQVKTFMLNSKMQSILKKLQFIISIQRQRIVVVVEDQLLEKRVKKFLKERQVEYCEYELIRNKGSGGVGDYLNDKFSNAKQSLFDISATFRVCILNVNKTIKQYKQINKNILQNYKNQQFTNQYDNHYQEYENFVKPYYSSHQNHKKLFKPPKITTHQSIHYIDTYWNQFSYEKQELLFEILSDLKMGFIEEDINKVDKIMDKVVRKVNVYKNYFVIDGSHEKFMLENYLKRKIQFLKEINQVEKKIKQETKLQNVCNKPQNLTSYGPNIQSFITSLLSTQSAKYNSEFTHCPIIQYLDIDQQYDKIQQQSKRLKLLSCNQPQKLQQKVYINPKFSNPKNKSFKELLEEELMKRNLEMKDGEQDKYNISGIETSGDQMVGDGKVEDRVKRVDIKCQARQQQKFSQKIKQAQIILQSNVKAQHIQTQQSKHAQQNPRKPIQQNSAQAPDDYQLPHIDHEFQQNYYQNNQIKIQNNKNQSYKQELYDEDTNFQKLPILSSEGLKDMHLEYYQQQQRDNGWYGNQDVFLKNNRKDKDLFDELLGEEYLINFGNNQEEQNQNINKVEKKMTKSWNSCAKIENYDNVNLNNQDKGQNKSYKSKQIKNQKQSKQDIFMLNFGSLAYNGQLQEAINVKKQQLFKYKNRQNFKQISLASSSKFQNLQKLNQINSKFNQQQQEESSIQIVQSTQAGKNSDNNNEIIDLEDRQTLKKLKKHSSSQLKNGFIKNKKIIDPSLLFSYAQSKNKRFIKPQFQSLQLKNFQINQPKQPKRINKRQYEQALSKSKAMWQKKLRKQKKILILPQQKKLSIQLTPKMDWKDDLTEEQVKELRQKGIDV